jgi:hypothetical protein
MAVYIDPLLDIKIFSSERQEWYRKFQKRLGLSDVNHAVFHHAMMYHVKDGELNKEYYLKGLESRSPEQRKILTETLEAVLRGEDYPHQA